MSILPVPTGIYNRSTKVFRQPAVIEKPQSGGIELRGVVKTYRSLAGNVRALDQITLQLPQGEFAALVGKSGAGKSTLVNMLSGIDLPDEGEIIVGGTALHTLNEDQRSRWRGLNLGIVFQFFQLLPSLSLIKNITIAMDFCSTYPPRERRPRALDLLDQVGIADHAYKTPAEISGGQQQRAAIARALANDPPILVADEPTGNLDSRTAGEVMELLERLAAQGKTLLIATHDASLAARAGRRIEISDGRIV
jgi:putative ABC transport system ATP-binding protein